MDIHTGNGAWRRSGVHPHRSNTQGRDWVCRPVSHSDRPAGTRMLHNRWLALTVAIHRASSGCHGGYPRPIRQNRPATRAPSPLKTTALRVIRCAGYPHGRESAEQWRGPGSATAPAFRARSDSSAGRALMLTVAALRVIGDARYPRGRESAEQWRGARKRHRAGIPCRKRLIGRSSADAHRRSASSDRGRKISTWARIRRAMAGSPEAPPRRHSVPEAAHRPVER